MKIKGNDILLFVGSTALAASKSCDIETECDIIEVSSPSSGLAKEFIAGRTEWRASGTFLLSAFATHPLRVGSVVTLTIGSVTSGSRTLSNDKLSGSAIITSCKITATRGNLAQGSFKFQGTGALS